LETLSVVVPVYDEEAALPAFYERLKGALARLPCSAEIVFVDDGSRDRSAAILDALAARDPRVRVIAFTRNFGHQAALCAGLDHCTGAAAVMIDADLQDPPELIVDFHAAWKAGHDVVYGERQRIREGPVKRLVYHLFYRLLRSLASIEIPLDTGDFALVDRHVIDRLKALPERTRFLRGLRTWVGSRQLGIEYVREARSLGESKYPLTKLLKLAFDGIVSFSTLPLRLALVLGSLVSLSAAALIVALVYLRLSHSFDLPGWTSLMVIVLFLGGIQLITVGIVGEYVARIYEEVKRRPLYLVARTRGFASDGDAAGLRA
jgi:dolichol-phosphate mannosyltransferase